MKAVTVSAPARVDLAGGSLDLWPLGLLVEGALTVNVAVGLRARAALARDGEKGVGLLSRDLGEGYRWKGGPERGPLALLERYVETLRLEEGWRLETQSDVPPGSGLGGSSALSVAVAAALEAAAGRRFDPYGLVALCRDVEAAHLGIPTGVQDFWPALHGGVLAIHYEPGKERVEVLPVDLTALGKRLVVAYSGRSRLSARTNWALVKRFLDGEPQTVRHLHSIAATARAMREALLEKDFDRAGRLLLEEWEERRGLADGVETEEVRRLLSAGIEAGALGGKACGAGGGGCLAFLVPEGARWKVERALSEAGARILPAPPSEDGLSVEVVP